MNVSIIVVCYNEEKNIHSCLNSIIKVDYPRENYEIVVVDNNSSDATQKIVREFGNRYNNIRLLINEERSISKSRNIGIKNSLYPYIAFTDADCEVPENWLKVLIDGFVKYKDKYSKLSAVGGTNYAPKDIDSFYDSVNITIKTLLGNRGSTQGREYTKDSLVSHIPTLNILYDKAIVKEQGYFDENFRFVCEDPEMNYRLIKSGYKIVMLKDSYVIHKFKKGFKNWTKNIFKYGMGRVQIIKKHPEHFSYVYFIPPIIILINIVGIVSLFLRFYFEYILLGYWIFLFLYSLFYSLKNKKIKLIVNIYLIYLTTHYSYALGEIYGLLFLKKAMKKK